MVWCIKGLPIKKINIPSLSRQGGREQGAGGGRKILSLVNWIIYFLEVPKACSSSLLLQAKHFSYAILKKECDRWVGWVERSETQHIQGFEALGFVPQL